MEVGNWPLWEWKERGGGEGVVRRIGDTCSCGVRPTRGGGGKPEDGGRRRRSLRMRMKRSRK